jgi:glycosyltransferase involved in cell wall biosynthesis
MTGARRLKVLLVTDEMEVGGTQRQIVAIAGGLDRRHFDVTVLYFRNRSFLVDELEAVGVPVVFMSKSMRIDPRFLTRLREFLVEQRFDVMHCFSFTGELWGAVARLLMRSCERPALVTSIRGKYEWYSRSNWLLKRLATWQSDAVVANSHAGAEYAADRMRLTAERITVIYNGVPLPAPQPSERSRKRAELGLAPDRFVALFVGRLVDHKDLPTLLRAARQLAREGADFRLLIVGDGPLRGAVEQQVAAHGLEERVTLLGECSDVGRLMAACDVLVLPSVREGLPNVVLEAMAAGLPVIASRAGGNVELINDGVDGLLFDVGDERQLASTIARLAADAALRGRLVQAARLKAGTRFSVPAMVDRLAHLYRRVAKARAEPVAKEAAA